jgi:hypothetical protein
VAKLWNKFLVVRRDGTVPEWPYLVMGARDPYVPGAIRQYAKLAQEAGEPEDYTSDLYRLADSFDQYRQTYGEGDPASPPHREDDPLVVSRIKTGSTPDGWRETERGGS